ncbi:MAG: 4Fe-4S dicluster domain-containing protein [Desulfobacterales bacterium]|nr:4Fe-4S dicluster domain-containing protein [Desulfobacterales bacterium]
MQRLVTTIIDQDKCIGCGLCVRVCPSQTISMQDETAAVTGDQSLSCGHCVAVCPADAVQVTAIDNDALNFKTFQADTDWLTYGEYDTGQLVKLMCSRRSCRNYTDEPVDRSVLEDLVKIGTTAPSGTNSQKWTFTILPTRNEVKSLGDQISLFFKKLNKMAEKTYLRGFLKLIGKNELDVYFHEYYESVKEALAEWENTGRDRLFHGATAAIIVGSAPGATCPKEDAMLATQNILLAAHSMGLGTCLIGFAVEAMKNDISVKRYIGIPDNEPVYAVIAIGFPDEKYQHQAGRRKIVPRYFEIDD